jgi:hypothetical protein
MGLELDARALQDDAGTYYCVAWPRGGPLQGPGGVQRCVLDVYGAGSLLTVDEVGAFSVQGACLLGRRPRGCLFVGCACCCPSRSESGGQLLPVSSSLVSSAAR